MAIYHLIYRSVATQPLPEAALNELLDRARAHNESEQITGILLHTAGAYLQVLEGEEAAVAALYARIEADARHTRVRLVTHGNSQRRIFPRWSMGYLFVGNEDFARLAGYVEPPAKAGGHAPLRAAPAKGYLALLEEFALAQPVLF